MTSAAPARARTRFSDLAEYRAARSAYRLDRPAHFNFGHDVVDRWAREQPGERALWWVGEDGAERVLTFAELSERSDRLAEAIRGTGLKRGEQVMVNLPSVPAWWEAMVGLTKADVIAIPTTVQLTAHDIAYRVEAAEIDAVITDPAGAVKLDEIAGELGGLRLKIQVGGRTRPGWLDYERLLREASGSPEQVETDADGPALIYFTSGTTGPPKMVLHTHASYGIGQRLTADFWLPFEPGHVHWNLSDPGWAKTAYAGYFGPWIRGATVFVSHRPGKFEPADVLDTLSRHPVESMCAPPTVYRMLLQEDLSGFEPVALRECRAAGEPLEAHVLERWRDLTGITIREGYGQTETVFLCGSIPDLPVKPGSMGLPPPTIDLAVIDGQGRRLPPGEPGEIAVRTEPERPIGLFREYWKNPQATAECFRDGWYRTGDLARIDEDGYFWFVSRADDIITSSAYRIGPFDVEGALMTHPAVAEVAVVGKPDPDRTEIVKAFVVLAAGHRPDEGLVAELQEHARRSTAPYKYPREIEFLDELPKTVTGKVRRNELRARV